MKKIALVEDNPSFRLFLRESLNDKYSIIEMSNIKQLRESSLDDVVLIIMDNRLPDGNGIDYIDELMRENNVNIVMLTAYGDIPTAIEAVKKGAMDFWTKPIDYDTLRSKVDSIMNVMNEQIGDNAIIGCSDFAKELRSTVARISSVDVNILITGESGTGKDYIARLIHSKSLRASAQFVVIDCNILNNELFESELFGNCRGAFSGADRSRKGKIDIAHKGTLYFDSIDSLSMRQQGKLLRFIESGEFFPLGSSKPCNADVRIIASSAIDLEKAVVKGLFRKDLLFRINIYPLKLISLKERMEDIPLFLESIMRAHEEKYGKVIQFSENEMNVLKSYEWPGNIRQMENIIERLYLEKDKSIIADLQGIDDMGLKEKLRVVTKEKEKSEICIALQKSSGNKAEAARILKISYRNLLEKIKEYDIE